MPKRPFSELRSTIERYDFFGENLTKVQDNLRDLTLIEVRSLIADLLTRELTSVHPPVNLAAISLLLNTLLCGQFSHLADVEDYVSICSLLSVLSQLQKNDEVVYTLDPKTLINLLIQVARYNHPDLSSFTIDTLRKTHESGLLHQTDTRGFICRIHGPLHNLIHIEPEKRHTEYLMNLIYLFEEKVLIHPDSPEMLRAARGSLLTIRNQAPGEARTQRIPTEEQQVTSHSLSTHITLNKKARPHCVPTPINTNLGPVSTPTIAIVTPPVRRLSPSEINSAKRIERFNKITTALATGNVILLERLFEEMNVAIKESPTHAAAPRQPHNRHGHFVGFFFGAKKTTSAAAAPKNPQGSAETREAAKLIFDYFKRRLNAEEKNQFLDWIRTSNASFFSTLFSPFRTNRKELYTLIERNGLDAIIHNISINELAAFINCLAGPGGLRIKQSAASLIIVLQCLTERARLHPEENNTIEPIFLQLVREGIEYHETKNTFGFMRGHPQVLKNLSLENATFDLILTMNRTAMAPLHHN